MDVRKNTGQATIEMALALPFIIWLLFYMINGYHTVHTSHIGQRYAAMNLYIRLSNRAKFVMDDLDNALHDNTFMAVQYLDGESDNLPKRKILFGPVEINSIVGICREEGC